MLLLLSPNLCSISTRSSAAMEKRETNYDGGGVTSGNSTTSTSTSNSTTSTSTSKGGPLAEPPPKPKQQPMSGKSRIQKTATAGGSGGASRKVQLIDQRTFDEQQHRPEASVSVTTASPYRNSKYKKKHQGSQQVDLLQFVVVKQKQGVEKKKRPPRMRRVVVDAARRLMGGAFKKSRGKTREGVVRKRATRLKKSILQYREERRQAARLDAQLGKTVQQLQQLLITPSEELHSYEAEVGGQEPMVRTTTVHSRSFRNYCDNLTSGPLGDLADQLLRELNRFQSRAFAVNPIKAQGHRRLVIGFREVQNYLRVDKLKMVLIATDCEQAPGPVGLNETIAEIKESCRTNGIPYGFPMRRRQLAYPLFKKVPVACVGVVDYDGARDQFNRLAAELERSKRLYRDLPKGAVHLQNIADMEAEE